MFRSRPFYAALGISFITATLVLTPTSFAADTVSELQQSIAGIKGVSGDFTQLVTDKNGKKKQESTGDFAIQRPGKFRWHYSKPYEQLIVGDGKKVWIYDPDLAQVTVKDVGKALDASPAALLSGDNNLEKRFNLKALPDKDGMQWVEAIPKMSDSNFTRVRLGVVQGDVKRMELEDSFGQHTLIIFTKLTRNPALSADLFHFVKPKGVDEVQQ